jgi:hypothetical protein
MARESGMLEVGDWDRLLEEQLRRDRRDRASLPARSRSRASEESSQEGSNV